MKRLLTIEIRSCKQCHELLGIYRPCTCSFINLNDEWLDDDCPLPEIKLKAKGKDDMTVYVLQPYQNISDG